MFEILDGLIATIGVVLVLSLVVQEIQQIIKQAWSFKSKYMEQELLSMFVQVRAVDTKATFGQNPLIRSLKALAHFLVPSRSQFKKMVADPQNEVYVGILDLVRARLASIGYDDLSIVETMTTPQFTALLEDIRDGLPEETKWTFDMTFKTAIEDCRKWFDLTQRAFQDHYQRRMKIWAHVLSAVVVVVLNANLISIYEQFSSNKVLREAAVQMASRLAATPRDSLIAPASSKQDTLARGSDSLVVGGIENSIARINSLVQTQSFHIIRWNTADGDPLSLRDGGAIRPMVFLADLGAAAKKNWLGWILMTLLVGLGAPFWYDVLKTFMGLKNRAQKGGVAQ